MGPIDPPDWLLYVLLAVVVILWIALVVKVVAALVRLV